MKKIIMMVATVLMFSANATMAQKIKVETYQAKLEKSDEAIQNPKKASKAATWTTRGNDYLDALQAPTAMLYTGMDAVMLAVTCGEPQSTSTEDIYGTVYETMNYPFFTLYLNGGKVAGWKTTKSITENATDVIIESYEKALELDPKQLPKVLSGLNQLINYYAQIGDISNVLYDYVTGAKAYTKVFDIQSLEAYDDANPLMLYYAGYMYTIAANEDPSLCPAGVEAFTRAIEAGYVEAELANQEVDDKEKGNIYYYLYHCYYGQKETNPSALLLAKGALIKGVEVYPKNQRIIDALAQLYTVEEGVGDPSELVSMIDVAIDADPTNADLWFARGRVFFSLKDYDNCIESFIKVTELLPDVFDGYFYLGLFYIYKADALSDEISSKTYTENAEYAKDVKASIAVYAAAIPILERAHEIKPDDLSTVEYLKSLCFRLRDEDGVMDKYSHYNALFTEMKANE